MPDPPDDEKFELVIGGETYADLLHDAASSVFMTQGATTKEMYNETIDEERDRIYLYLGDDAGYLKLWDLALHLHHLLHLHRLLLFRHYKQHFH